MIRPIKPTIATVLAAFLLVAVANVTASEFDTPNSSVNPATGNIETADPVWSGSSRNVHYVTDPGDGSSPDVFVISDHEEDDLSPKLVIADNGNAWVTWWRDGVVDQVLVRKRDGGTWGGERLLSESDEDSRRPVLAHDGTTTWVAYELDVEGQTGIAVGLVIDEPDPIGIRLLLGQTDFGGSREITIRAEDAHLWVTWVDSSTEVAWVEYDDTAGSWGLPAYESYVNDTPRDARTRIRATVLGAP